MPHSTTLLTINPGATSTKIACFTLNDTLDATWHENLRHDHADLSAFPSVIAQRAWRRQHLIDACQRHHLSLDQVQAFCGRGGPIRPMTGGVYRIDAHSVDAIVAGHFMVEHPSLLGVLLAFDLAQLHGAQAYTVDPVCVDELIPEARLSGHPDIARRSLTHALSLRDVAQRAAAHLGRPYQDLSLIVCHFGSGISVSAHRRGRMIDVNDSSGEGPFSAQRCGSLPARALVERCQAPDTDLAQLHAQMLRRGGLFAYRGSDDFAALLAAAAAGDAAAELLYGAFLHQCKKEIAAYAGVLDGQVDLIACTGALLQAQRLRDDLRHHLAWIAPVLPDFVEDEAGALARGAARALTQTPPPPWLADAPAPTDRHEESR